MKSNGSAWPFFIISLLGANMAVVGITVYFAKSDPGFSVEPHYYQKAIRFEDRQREIEHNLNLGWTGAIRQVADVGDVYELRLDLSDREGRPVPGVSARGVAFHNAHAADIVAVEFAQTPDGLSARLHGARPGLWTFQIITKSADGQSFSFEQELSIGPEPDPSR